jgi:chromosome segregation ATPase
MSDQMGQVALSQEQMAEVRLSALIKKLEDAEALHALIEQMTATAQEKLTEITSAANAALIAKAMITDERDMIATKSSHIRNAQEHADKVGAELERLQKVATQHVTEAEGLRIRAQTATDNAVQILAEIQSHEASAATVAASTSTLHDESKSAVDATKKLADKAETVEKRIADYEGRLSELEAQFKAQLETITGLLPGATAVGLAHSFDQRRQTFLDPSNHWQWLRAGPNF